jgi:cytoskeletal protein RodZ
MFYRTRPATVKPNEKTKIILVTSSTATAAAAAAAVTTAVAATTSTAAATEAASAATSWTAAAEAASTAAPAAWSSAATAACFTACFVDLYSSAVDFLAVGLFDCFISFCFIRHFDKTETSGFSAELVLNDVCGFDLAKLLEEFLQIVFGCVA